MRDEQLRGKWVDWAASHEWDDFLTLNFNCRSNFFTARKQLGKFLQRLDSCLLGSKYRKKLEERCFVMAFAEHVSTNCHWHCLIKYKCDQSRRAMVSRKLLEYFWKGIVPSGSVHRQDVYDAAGAARYSGKERGSLERIVLSSDFWPHLPIQEVHDLERANLGEPERLRQIRRYANYRRQRLRRANGSDMSVDDL